MTDPEDQPDVMGDYLAAGWSITPDGQWVEPKSDGHVTPRAIVT
jgi:hypothetical protein